MTVKILRGHVLDRLVDLPDESVHCVVTSPPYWGLRDYNIPPQLWAGDPGCVHEFERAGASRDYGCSGGGAFEGSVLADLPRHASADSGLCRRCGAWLGSLGLEPDPRLYAEHIVAVFRAVRRVLRPDGTVWLNLGDTYIGGGNGGGGSFAQDGIRMGARPGCDKNVPSRHGDRGARGGLKPKDLAGIPWRVALALQEDGWYLRRDIIWSKPNPMPESVTDRPTTAHEYLFLLSKSPSYYYDAEAIRERAIGTEIGDIDGGPQRLPDGSNANAGRNYRQPNSPQSIASPHGQGFARRARHGESAEDYARLNDRQDALHTRIGRLGNAKTFRGGGAYTQGQSFDNSAEVVRDSHGNEPNATFSRNKRSVWTVATQPFGEAHFATFPPKLIEPCILAGTSEKGVCGHCGAPWARKLAKKPKRGSWHDHGADLAEGAGQNGAERKRRYLESLHDDAGTVGWIPTCICHNNQPAPATILDPFGGAGTTGLVADRLGRNAILIEFNEEYAAMAERRLRRDAGLFADVRSA